MADDFDKDRDGRHDFRAATLTANDDQLVDDEGHRFAHGRVELQDEADEE